MHEEEETYRPEESFFATVFYTLSLNSVSSCNTVHWLISRVQLQFLIRLIKCGASKANTAEIQKRKNLQLLWK